MKRHATDWEKIFAKHVIMDSYVEYMKNSTVSKIIRKWAKEFNRYYTKDTQLANKHMKVVQHH